MRPYTRSLDPADYAFLPKAEEVRVFQRVMSELGIPHHVSHEHKFWECASVMQQLSELSVPTDAEIIDVGSGGMYFPPYLATLGGYPHLALTDSADLEPMIEAQRHAYDVALPFFQLRAEEMSPLLSETFDVVMCISTIEHIAAGNHDRALYELWRLCKPGGLIFITSDYFRSNVAGGVDYAQYNASPFRHCQETPYHKELILNIPNLIPVEFVGDTDLDYRGDFVHNYSFCNVCLRKLSPASTGAQFVYRALDNGKGV